MARFQHVIAPVLALVATASLHAPAVQATAWDYTTDFAAIVPQVGQGSGNAWWWFKADAGDFDGAYTLFFSTSGGNYSNPGNAFHLAGATFVHPGTFNFSNPASNPEPDVIIGFRAPASDGYHVSGFMRDNDGTDFDGPADKRGVLASIWHGTSQVIAPTHIDAQAPAVPDILNFDFNIALNAGDYLFFRVNDRGSNRFDTTGVSIQISDGAAVPEPGGMLAALVLLLGATAAGRALKRE